MENFSNVLLLGTETYLSAPSPHVSCQEPKEVEEGLGTDLT